MDINKNYYAILGVLPTAEDIVVRAAYKALAQRYHPDRYQGPVEDANRLMKEINEAFSVLSNPAIKAQYDKQRKQSAEPENGYFDEKADNEPPCYDPLSRDWELAIKFYPDLRDIESRLARIAWRLAYAYRASMLEMKNFEERKRIADGIESQFMEIYFGKNPAILKFANELIQYGHKAAAKALNKSVKLFGEKINPDVVIPVIKEDFNIIDRPLLQNVMDIRSLMHEIKKDGEIYSGQNKKILLIKRLGGRYVETKGFFSNSYLVVLGDINKKFIDLPAFSKWVSRELIPQLLALDNEQFISFLNAASSIKY